MLVSSMIYFIWIIFLLFFLGIKGKDYPRKCLASSLVNTENDGVLPYPDMYFSTEEIIKFKSPVELLNSDKNKPVLDKTSLSTELDSSSYYYNTTYGCLSFDIDKYSNDTAHLPTRPDILIPVRHICYPKLCPMYVPAIAATLSPIEWTFRAPAICRLHNATSIKQSSRQKHHQRTVRLLVFGGSMTKSEDVMGLCCLPYTEEKCSSDFHVKLKKELNYCSWVGYYSRWLRTAFPRVEFEVYNLAQNGVGCQIMSHEATSLLHYHNISLTSDDIVIIDHSANDQEFSALIDVERLVRQLMLYAKSIPTIILVEQFMHFKMHYTDEKYSDPTKEIWYVNNYRKVARHYHLPIFSYFEMVWSKFMKVKQNYLAQILRTYELHPPWHVHMFIADALAGFTMQIIKMHCSKKDMNKPFHRIPKALTDAETADLTMCDPTISTLIHYLPKNKMKPNNLTEFESKLQGWTDFADYHGVPGWIINMYAPRENWEIFFNITEAVFNVQPERAIVIRVNYLRTYRNAGRVRVFLCGQQVGVIDGLFKFNDRKVSIPQLFTHRVTSDALKSCANISSQLKLIVRYEGLDDPDYNPNRMDWKFKLLSVNLCVAQDDK